MKRRIATVVAVMSFMAALAALVLYLHLSDFWAIDRCLDAGGRWNQESRACEYR